MAITTTCPSCRGPLRIPDELVGQRVRCPTCQNVFEATTDAPAPPPSQLAPPPRPSDPKPERPLWKDLNLELDKTDPGESKKSAPGSEEAPTAPLPPRKPGLVGAVEVKLSIDDEPDTPARPAPRSSAPTAPPRRPEPPQSRRPPPPAPRPRDDPGRDDDDEDYRGSRRSFFRRRDTVPHRGTMILVFGIISIVSVFLTCAYIGPLIGIGLGITAWVLGQADLRKIKNQEMDDEGLGTTQAGWICGIIGTILNTLILLACGGFLAFVLYMDSVSHATTARPSFAPPPPPAVGGK